MNFLKEKYKKPRAVYGGLYFSNYICPLASNESCNLHVLALGHQSHSGCP